MHKHSNTKKTTKKRMKNANFRLSAPVVDLLTNLTALVDDHDFASQYLVREYLSKYADPQADLAEARKAAAIAKFLATDEENKRTNERLLGLDGGYNILPRVSLNKFLSVCRDIVRKTLGRLNDDLTVGAFSGGSSTSRRRLRSHPGFKLSAEADVTVDAAQYLDVMYREMPILRSYGIFTTLTEVEGAVLFTVPKKNDIDRCACKEPDINMFLQKGVGKHIRRRLKRGGINLNDQTINRNLAQLGSRDGTLATLDLSAASDSIAIELVRLLLPTEWFLYLNDIRSRKVWVDGTLVETEMFSSMGNGFTFELESLLFWSIVRTTCYLTGVPGRVSIYGDDIICPSDGADDVTWALSVLGFKTNQEKSFSAGPFRESCGGHYHHGKPVTPFYLKRPPARLTDLIRVTNQLRKWALQGEPVYGRTHYVAPWVYPLWSWLRSEVPSKFWGGSDLDVDTQLVDTTNPRQKLVRVTGEKKVPQSGLYLLWQNSNWSRAAEPEEGYAGDVLDTHQMCRSRPAPSLINWGDKRTMPIFWEEDEHYALS